MVAEQDAALVAQKILEAFIDPFHLVGHALFVTVSLGSSLYPVDQTEPKGMFNVEQGLVQENREGEWHLRKL